MRWLFNNTIGGLVARLRFWWGTRRSALTTIKFISAEPKTIIDCGCNNSQWSQYLKRKWPLCPLYSIDGNPFLNPLGMFINVALGCENSSTRYSIDGKASKIDPHGMIPIPLKRLDSLGIPIHQPSVLKVDCDCHTYEALIGSGEMLSQFDYAIVEMVNTTPGGSVFGLTNRNVEICQLMFAAGFNRMEVIDATVWPNGVDYVDCLFMKD